MVWHPRGQGGNAESEVDVIALALVGNQAQLAMQLCSGVHCQRLTQHAAQLEPGHPRPSQPACSPMLVLITS